jgi:hypothetical protein
LNFRVGDRSCVVELQDEELSCHGCVWAAFWHDDLEDDVRSFSELDQVQITCGRIPADAFEFVMQREALRALVELGTDALEQMDSPALAE